MNTPKNPAPRPLNKSATAIDWAQEEIARIVKDGFFWREDQNTIKQKAKRVIDKACRDITIPELRQDAFFSLWRLYEKQMMALHAIPRDNLMTFLALGKLTKTADYASDISEDRAEEILASSPSFRAYQRDESIQYGVPLSKFVDRYFSENIEPAIEKMLEEESLDPNDSDNRTISLRAKAERLVRYEHNQKMVDDLRESGTRLVVCSTHGDCSKRCRAWQGRVYSLDHTKGKTDDGRDFIPLEIATDIKTKNGRWNNGLLGFNCRHYLVPYKTGLQFGEYSEKVEKKEYEITLKQRAMEREIIRLRKVAEKYRGTAKKLFTKANKKTKKALDDYRAFSKKNGRAVYIARTKI